MPPLPEQQARVQIDDLLTASGWVLQNYKELNLGAGRGIALREVPLKTGPCDYLLLVGAQRRGVSPRSTAFSPDQLAWLHLMRDHVATSLSLEFDDFEFAPFAQRGGLGKAHQLFGEQLPKLLDELNRQLVA